MKLYTRRIFKLWKSLIFYQYPTCMFNNRMCKILIYILGHGKMVLSQDYSLRKGDKI